MSYDLLPSAANSAGVDEAAAATDVRRPPVVVESSALDLTLRALRPILIDRDVTEICINRPGRRI